MCTHSSVFTHVILICHLVIFCLAPNSFFFLCSLYFRCHTLVRQIHHPHPSVGSYGSRFCVLLLLYSQHLELKTGSHEIILTRQETLLLVANPSDLLSRVCRYLQDLKCPHPSVRLTASIMMQL